MKYFKMEEFNCKCCRVQHMDALFLSQLDNARDYAGVPFEINSGWRCEKHNIEVKSESKNHTSGKAVDIKCEYGPARLKIIMGLIRAGFRRIGVRKDFIHVDSMNDIESMWVY